MAVVLTSLSAAFTRTPFIKIPDLQRELTAMPRSIINFQITNGTLDAKPINDQQELNISVVLPTEFAYRLVALNGFLVQSRAHVWRDRAYLEITNGPRGLALGATQEWPAQLERVNKIPTFVTANCFRLLDIPTDILQSDKSVAPTIVFKASNVDTVAAGAGTVSFLVTFLEYDIEQAQRFMLHWPVLTYSR